MAQFQDESILLLLVNNVLTGTNPASLLSILMGTSTVVN